MLEGPGMKKHPVAHPIIHFNPAAVSCLHIRFQVYLPVCFLKRFFILRFQAQKRPKVIRHSNAP